MVIEATRFIIFDTAIEAMLKHLLDLAMMKHPNRSWLAEIVLWDDSDYEFKLISSWGGTQDVYRFRKSDGISKYEKRKILGGGYQTLEEQKLN